MKLSDIKQLNEAITADKQKFLDILYGKSAGKNLKDKIGLWLWNNLVIVNDEITPQSTANVQKYLTSLGFSKTQIHDLRDLFTQTTKAVVDQVQRKYGKEIIPDKFVAAGSEWFGVYTLYLNIPEQYHKEFKKMVKQVFTMKVDKAPDEMFIPENK